MSDDVTFFIDEAEEIDWQFVLSLEVLATLTEGQLINAAWWLWECEQIVKEQLAKGQPLLP